ncbi:MAG: hypothetical protein JWO03_2865 [Bacteroidetes bacterium]|nr:hypothetical protein [Bacteroidota bacterium]
MINFFQNLSDVTSTPGMGRVLWTPCSAILTYPAVPATGTTPGETVIAVGDFTFAPGNGWLELRNDLLKGSEMDSKSMGDIAAPGLEVVSKTRVIGLSPQLVEQYINMVGLPGVALVQDSKCRSDQWWAIGCDCDPAFLTFEFKSGTKGGNDAKATALEFKSMQAPYLYSGTVLLQQYIAISIIYNP